MIKSHPELSTSATKGCCVPVPVQVPGNTPVAPASLNLNPGECNEQNLTTTLVSIDGGWFQMGANDGPHPEDGEGPVRDVYVDGYFMSPTCVSNAEFAAFIEATGFVTSAEREGHSFVFHLFDKTKSAEIVQAQHAPWWHLVKGACWRSPEGPGSSWTDKPDHPVIQVSYSDVQAYCHWAGVRLPTEAEWEYAARGRLLAKPYPWGNQLTDGKNYNANVWQGEFPNINSAADGFVGTAPVNAYNANAFGLYNVIGNVWEWTSDRHTRLHSPRAVKNPTGPLNGDKFVAKGGSFLCHESYCFRYRTSSRQGLTPQTTTGNVGFRVAADSPS